MRFIVVDDNNVVIGIRNGNQQAVGEIQSDTGDLGQIMQADGTFIDGAPLAQEESQLDRMENTLDILLLKQEGIL